MWIFLFVTGLTSDVDACAGGPERRVGSRRAWQGVGWTAWDGNVGPLIRAAGASEASGCGKCGCACFQAAKSGSSRVESRTAREETKARWVWLACRALGHGRVRGRVCRFRGRWLRDVEVAAVSQPASQSTQCNAVSSCRLQLAVCRCGARDGERMADGRGRDVNSSKSEPAAGRSPLPYRTVPRA